MAATLLLRTPEPLPGESMLGYVLRVSEANGYETPWHVLRHAGYEQGEMLTASFSMKRLADVLGKPSDRLRAYEYRRFDNGDRPSYALNGHSLGGDIRHDLLRMKCPAICPRCIEDQGYVSAWWDVSAFVACPKHGTMLLRRCPGCGAALSWFRPGLLKCSCGSSLAGGGAQRASAATVELMRLLQSKMTSTSPTAPESGYGGLPRHDLVEMSLPDLLRLISVLGRFRSPADTQTCAVEVAVEALADWPAGFHLYLRRMGQQALTSTEPSTGLKKQFHKLYGALFRARSKVKGVKFMRDAFIDFGLDEWGQATPDAKLLRGNSRSGRYLSASAFARLAGVRPITVKKWLGQRVIESTVVQCASQSRYIVDSESAATSLRRGADRLQAREAARIAGIPVSVLTRLKRAGRYSLNPVINRRQGFWAEDLRALAASVVAVAVELPNVVDKPGQDVERLLTLREILYRKKFGSSRAKAQLIEELLDAKLAVYGRSSDSMGQLLVRSRDIEDLRRRIAESEGMHTVSRKVAAAMLGSTAFAVDGLIDERHLQRDRVGYGGILRDSVVTFQRSWTSAHAIAKELETNSIWVTRRAVSLGVKTLNISAHGCRATFIEVDGVSRIAIDGTQRKKRRDEAAQKIPSGEVRAEAEKALRAYLSGLQATGQSLPMRGGKPNRVAIATICKFPRDLFYSDSKLLSLLDSDDRRKAVDALGSHSGALDRYLDGLRAAGSPLPMRCGKPNRVAIAAACGFARNVFYNHPEMTARLAALESEL